MGVRWVHGETMTAAGSKRRAVGNTARSRAELSGEWPDSGRRPSFGRNPGQDQRSCPVLAFEPCARPRTTRITTIDAWRISWTGTPREWEVLVLAAARDHVRQRSAPRCMY